MAYFHDPSINDRGQVASAAVDGNGTSRAFLWDGERMTMLPTPAGMNSTVADINDRGQVLGALTAPGGSTEHAVLWQHGRMIKLGTLGGAGSTPEAINERGQVIGNSTIAGSSEEHPFLWQGGRMTDLLAGTDATTARVTAINGTGMMTGRASFGDHYPRPVLWRDGQMIDIGLPGHVGIGTGTMIAVTSPVPPGRIPEEKVPPYRSGGATGTPPCSPSRPVTSTWEFSPSTGAATSR